MIDGRIRNDELGSWADLFAGISDGEAKTHG